MNQSDCLMCFTIDNLLRRSKKLPEEPRMAFFCKTCNTEACDKAKDHTQECSQKGM